MVLAYNTPGSEYLAAYRHCLATHECLEMWFIKVVLLGAPRLGKTTARRRLTGEISDISSSGEAEQPSTGAVESAPSVVIRNLSSTTALVTPTEWTVVNNLPEEARVFLEMLYYNTQRKEASHDNNIIESIERFESSPHEIAQGNKPRKLAETPDQTVLAEQAEAKSVEVISDLPSSAKNDESQASQAFSEIISLFRKAVALNVGKK